MLILHRGFLFTPKLGGFWGGLGFFLGPFWGDVSQLLGGLSWGFFSTTFGGFCLPVLAFFFSLLLVYNKKPRGFTGSATALRQPPYTQPSPKMCSLCFMVQFRLVILVSPPLGWVVSPYKGVGGMAHLFVNQKSQYQKTGCFRECHARSAHAVRSFGCRQILEP